jgi:hypothetical protein
MRSPNCRAESVSEDVYCRHCGTDLTEPSKGIVPTKSSLPALLYTSPVPRRVAAGVGALALGVGIELIRRNMFTRIFSSRAMQHALPVGQTLKDVIFSQHGKTVKLPRGYEMHETVVSLTRIIRREN